MLNIRLSTKLIVGFGIISSLTVFLGIFAIYQLGHVQNASARFGAEWIPTIYALSDINTKISEMRIQQNQHILAETPMEMAQHEAEIEKLLGTIREHQNLYESVHLIHPEVTERERNLYERFSRLFDEHLAKNYNIFYPLSRKNNDVEATQFLIEMRQPFKEYSRILSELVDINTHNTAQATRHTEHIYQESKVLIIAIILLAIIFSTTLASIIIRKLLLQIGGEPERIAEITFKVSQGDLSMDLGEGGTGIYASIKTMVANLRENASKNNEQNWIKDGLNRLSKELSGDNSLNRLCYKAISYLSRYVDAGQGAFYIYRKETNDLVLHGTYAFVERDALSNCYEIGQGVVGQVAFEKQPILLKNIQRWDATIKTAIISAPPYNTYTLPLLFENNLQGVMELAAFEPFTELKQAFLIQASHIIATSLYSVRQAEETKYLLEIAEQATREAQERATTIELVNAQLEMQQQQLEEQARILQEKNTQLQKQQQQMSIQAEELKLRNQSLLQTQQALDQRAQELIRSNQYKSEFLANMSHELRTPLNSIILLSKMFIHNKQDNLLAEDIKRASVIHEAGQELLRLIEDILDLSKVEAGKMSLHFSQFHTQDFIAEFHDLFDSVAKEKGLLFHTIDKANCWVHQEKQRIGQILRNFLANAFKFTKQGSVTLEITRQDEDKLVFHVVDTGIGIPQDKQKLVFEAFQQGDGSISREFGGTGLGLSIAASLANLLKGEIKLVSEEHKGSDFSLIVPINAELKSTANLPVKPLVKQDDPDLSFDKNEKIILIIEDDVLFAQHLTELICNMNFKPILSQSGQEGIMLAKQHVPHGIILDLGLPDIDGETVLKTLKSSPILRHIPVEIISARDKQKDFLNNGALGFLQKPFSITQFNQAIDRLVTFSEKNPKQVLLVEDNQLQQQFLQELLNSRQDTQINAVIGQTEAINEINKGYYDLAVVDLTLQQGDGFEVCRYIRDNYPELPIIVYTGRDLAETEIELLYQSVQRIIFKGLDSERFLLEQVSLFLHRLGDITGTPPTLEDLMDKRVLIVDDDIKNIFVLASSLEECGAEVIDAQDGQTALDILQVHTVDIVLMDIMMPGMDGLEIIQIIRKDARLKHLPIIAVTAKALSGDREKCLAMGANDYLVKPLNYEELIHTIKYWCDNVYRT